MSNVLPAQAGLTVNGVIYVYTVEKDPNSDFVVTVRNKDALGPGYIFESEDDWSQRPGTTLNRLVGVENIPGIRWGDGEIHTEGEGDILNPKVAYTYRYDQCYNPLTDPSCPGYMEALLAWLKENGLLDNPPMPGDPYYDEWVQATLNRDQEEGEEAEEGKSNEEMDEEGDDTIKALNANIDIDGFIAGDRQNEMMASMSSVNLDSYYAQAVPGGSYNDTVILQDSTLPDNARAVRSLASDSVHRSMVRSQYDRN